MKIKDLVIMIMQRKRYDFQTALYYLYSSELYILLCDDSTKLWYESSEYIYQMLKEEKRKKHTIQAKDEKIIQFCIFCRERYIYHHKAIQASEALDIFRKYNVDEFLKKTYDVLHTQDEAYIMDSINDYINN